MLRHALNRKQAVLVMSVIAFGAVFVVSRVLGAEPPSPADPFAGMDPSDKEQAMRDASAAEEARQRQFVADFEAQGRDPRSLEVAHLNALIGSPHNSVDEAAKAADLIVLAEGVDVVFKYKELVGVTEGLLRVEEVVKGDVHPGQEIRIRQFGGPLSYPGHEYLAVSEVDPLVLPGDRVILFLVHDAADIFVALAPLGHYRVESGAVVPVMPDHARADISGRSVDEVLRSLASLSR